MYDPLKNGDDSPKFVGVRDDLGDGSVNAEVETSLNLELLDFIPNVLDHFVQLVKVLLMKPGNISEKICFLFLCFYGSLQFGNLHCVVGGQCESRSCGNK